MTIRKMDTGFTTDDRITTEEFLEKMQKVSEVVKDTKKMYVEFMKKVEEEKGEPFRKSLEFMMRTSSYVESNLVLCRIADMPEPVREQFRDLMVNYVSTAVGTVTLLYGLGDRMKELTQMADILKNNMEVFTSQLPDETHVILS